MTTTNNFLLAMLLTAIITPATLSAQELLAENLDGAFGSTIGPDGALYVTERLAGRVSRIDPWTGDVTPFATNLPIPVIDIGVGGASDVAFIDGVAYVLVNVVGPAFDFIAPGFGGTDAVGIYRVDGLASNSLIADIGSYSRNNLPDTGYFLDHGVQYAMEPFRGGLLVTDGHHNRLLWVNLDGDISEFNVFENIVPTGLEVHGKTVYMGQAGPIPHEPANGKVVSFEPRSLDPVTVASGAPLVVDVEFGLGRTLYVLAQGEWCAPPEIDPECDDKGDGAPAEPDGGSLLEVNPDGSLTEIVGGLNLPTSLEFIGNTAYIVSLSGEVWFIDHVSEPPFGRRH